MALGYKARRRWSLLILLVGLPLYIMLVVSIMNRINIQNGILEFVIYVILGVAWAFPFKNVFRGIGQADPNAENSDD